MRAIGHVLGGSCLAWLLLLTVCGAQAQAPVFVEVSGGVQLPCAIGAPASKVVQHCTARVVLANKGGEGLAHVTIIVPLVDAKGGSASVTSVKCGRSVPDTPGGDTAELLCDFDLPPGKTVATYPVIGSVDYIAASPHGSPGFDFTGAGTLVLAGATVLLTVALLIAAPWRRGSPVRSVAPEVHADKPGVSSASASGRARSRSSRRDDIDAEYNLPSMPT